MYRLIDGSDPAARGTAPRLPAPDDGRLADAVRRIGTLAALLLIAAALLGCDEPVPSWGSTESADRTSADRAERRATPPPTPDYRELTAASPADDRPDGDGSGDADGPGRPLPEDVSYPEAESLYHQGDYRRAVRHFEAYTRDRPDNPWGHYMLGLSAWKAGDLERAVRGLEAALERDPEHVKSLVNLSRVLLELDRPEEAREPVRRALETAPRSADALRVAGNVALEQGETGTAMRRYRQALAVDDLDAWSANNLGLLRLREGRFADALGPLARAVELRPDVGVFRNNLGVALERTGHLAQARAQYRAAADTGHDKAEASLARLEGVSPDRTSEPVELETLARRFSERAEGWEVDRLARRPSPTGTADAASGSPEGDDSPSVPGGPEEADTTAAEPDPDPETETGSGDGDAAADGSARDTTGTGG